MAEHRKADETARAEKSGGILETIRTIGYAVAFALVVRTFLYEPFNIPSGSMVPTLLIGDYLFVSKFSYGYSRHSFPFSLGFFSGRILDDPPERGDVAVFKLPRDTSKDYIKRIVGLPGDRIQVMHGVLHIDGEPVKRRRISDYRPVEGSDRTVPQYVETLPNGRQYTVIEVMGDQGPLDDTQEYVVPQGHYFAMGDNRDSSLDSRVLHEVGFIPAENLVGRAEFLFFSTSGEARLWEVWKWPFTIRYGRLFDGIQ